MFSTLLPLNKQYYTGVSIMKQIHTQKCRYLVTSAEMMSVIVLLSSLRSSSIGPGMGSCCLRCSALRICCLFCQIVSANFSHLLHTHTQIKMSLNITKLQNREWIGYTLNREQRAKKRHIRLASWKIKPSSSLLNTCKSVTLYLVREICGCDLGGRWKTTHHDCRMSRPPSGGPPLPASCCRLFHWISSSSRMMVCCFLKSCRVFWCFSARS